MSDLPTSNGEPLTRAPARSAASALMALAGPRTAALVGSCVLVTTAYTLGLDWLGTRFIGLPTGLWLVGLVMLLAQYRHQNGGFNLGGLPAEDAYRPLPRLNFGRVASALPDSRALGGVLELVGVPAEAIGQARKRIGAIGSRVTASPTTLRIGVDLADGDARELIAYGLHEGNLGVPVEWVKARSGLVTDVEADMAAGGLDVLIRRERRGDVDVFVAEHPDRPAAWPEWGTPMPLSYAAVFPPRVDPSRVALAGCDFSRESHARLAARMVLACAMLARVPGRAGGPRTGLGRMIPTRAAMPELVRPDGPLGQVMRRTLVACEQIAAEAGPAGPLPPMARSAARAAGAYLTGIETAAGEPNRTDAVALAARLTPDELESQLRLAAAMFAEGRADEARSVLATACTQLRRLGRTCESDPLAFIMSEVELGSAGRMTLGRIAAGIGLLWATAPGETLDYVREDLLDDLAHAGWLRERPADVELLKGVITALEATGTALRAAA